MSLYIKHIFKGVLFLLKQYHSQRFTLKIVMCMGAKILLYGCSMQHCLEFENCEILSLKAGMY